MWQKKLKNIYFIIIAIGLNFLFFYPVLFSEKTFFFRDIHRWFYPMKYFLASSLKGGFIPFWCPNYFGGSPFISDLQSGAFYPLSLFFLFFLFPKAFNLFVITHFFLGFCFFYLFIKGIGLSRKSALFTSISYCYGGYTIASINTLNNLTTSVWLPAILWAFQKGMTANNKSGRFFILLFLCMSILGGEPQLFIMTIAILFLYGPICIPREGGSKSSVKIFSVTLLLIASTLILTIVQLGPAYIDYQLSTRMGGISYEEATRHSLDPEMLRHLLLPLRFPSDFTTNPVILKSFFPGNGHMPWLLTIYPGMMILPLALFAVSFCFSRVVAFWMATFIVTLFLALGDSTPIYRIFYGAFPFFRFPEKFMFLAGFSLLVMAAYGFDKLLNLFRGIGVKSDIIFLLFAITLAIDLYLAHKYLNPLSEPSFYQTHHEDLQPLFDDPGTFRVYVDPENAKLDHAQDTILNHHLRWQNMMMPNIGVLHNLEHVDGTTGLELRYQYLITEILLKPWKEKINFLKLSNVKYIISSNNLGKIPELKDQVEKINPIVYKIKNTLPRAWMVGKLKPIRKGTIEELINGSFDPVYTALAKGDIVSRYKEPFFGEIENIRYERDNIIHIELTADMPGVLVLSESSYPGWQVFVNGVRKEYLWLNLLYQGVEIEKGKHKIEFIYQPKYFTLFAIISLVSLILFVFTWSCYIFFVKKKDIIQRIKPRRRKAT